MTTQTNATRPADSTIPYPALHHDGDYTWKPATRTKQIVIWSLFTLAFALASVYVQLISEDEYVVVIARTIEIPAVAFTGLGTAVGLILLVAAFRPLAPWYQDWSYLEVREEEAGLRVFAGRLGKDHPGILVRSNEVLEISGSRGDSLDEAELTVKAPAGSFEVDVDTYLTSLDIKPLEAAVGRYAIELRLTGVATEIPRSSLD